MESPRRSYTAFALSSPLALLVACGGGATPPAHEPPAPVAAAPAPEAAPKVEAALPASDDDDPDESSAPIALTPLVTRPWDKATFPPKPASAADEEKCWRSVAITGSAQQDFDALIASCGTPMGLVEYAKPAHGHLHSVKDKRDSFTVPLYKGLCYRYFAVGDSGIKDIDILIEKKGNTLVGDDKQNGPIAIIDASKTWCMTTDAEYSFNVEVDGEGKGKYVFGVWARPK
jgi:hypothetical protein